MGLSLEKQQMPKIFESAFLAISVDEATEATNSSLLSIVIYYLDENF